MKKFYLLLLNSFFLLHIGLAQTAINPITGGGFDAGNTFAINGWNVVNSSANRWVVGSTTYNSAPNSAYISIDGNVNNYSYDNTAPHVSHFYQIVTLPVGAINIGLTFYLKGNLQNDAFLNVIDGLMVYADKTLTTPVADALPGPGAVLQLPQFNSNGPYISQTITLDPSTYAGTSFLVIFTWVNNGDGIGANPPASIDNISLTYCIQSVPYALTGGGGFCTGTAGADIGLAGSVAGISYQLYKDGIPIGSPVAGTGSPLDFGPQDVGNYTVVGTSGACTNTMPGSVDVTVSTSPVASIASNAPLCPGATLNFTSGGGIGYSWTGPDGFTSLVQNPSIPNVTTNASGTYMVTVTDAKGCADSATTDVTIAAGGVVGGTIASVFICNGGNGTLTLSGSSNNPVRWEYTTDSTSATWTTLSNTTLTQTFTGITVPTFYRAVVNNGCGDVYSSIATVGIGNYWTGTIDTDWNTPANWSDNQVPGISCPDVYIPLPANNNLPVISAAVPAITNLHILSGATVSINNTGTLTLGGTISETDPGSIIARTGTLNLNGGVAQTIPATTFQNNDLDNLIINNTHASGVSLAGPLNIYESVTYGAGGTLFTTNDNLTLKSTAAQTAWLGNMTGHSITGNVTVERYIATGTTGAPNHGKSWQFLATPTQGQTLKQSWGEGATQTNIASPLPGSPGNPNGGFGTMLTNDLPDALATGFDAYTPTGPSIKIYDYLTNGFTSLLSTAIPIYNQKGYFVFVRGDRSVSTALAAATPTVLRTKGILFTPSNPAPPTTVTPLNFESVGNPYASAIDMRQIGRTGGVQEFFAVWDPRLGGAFNYGAYQYFSFDGTNYTVTPGGGSYGAGGSLHNTIESGQAFLMQAFGSNGNVTFSESSKISGSKLFTTPVGPSQARLSFRSTLNAVNSDGTTGSIIDGVFNSFDITYSNGVDEFDARKSPNASENLSIRTSGKLLAIERRQPITPRDTVFLNINNMKIQQYRFQFDAQNLGPGLQAFLMDNYLNIETAININGVTGVNFDIQNIQGSYAADRFMIVFAHIETLPTTVTSIKAYPVNKNINVEWRIDNENNMKEYTIEKSTEGIRFEFLGAEAPKNNNGGSSHYMLTDYQAVFGYNYYRLKSVDITGRVSYSEIVKVFVGKMNERIAIYPNPITDGMIHLQLINQAQGKYEIRLLNKLGQLIVQKQITHGGGSATELIQWNYNLAHGMYQLQIRRPDGSLRIINVLY